MFLDWARSHLPVKHSPHNAISGVKFPYSHLMKTPVKIDPFKSFDRIALLHCLVVCLKIIHTNTNSAELPLPIQQLEAFVRRAVECDIKTLDE